MENAGIYWQLIYEILEDCFDEEINISPLAKLKELFKIAITSDQKTDRKTFLLVAIVF